MCVGERFADRPGQTSGDFVVGSANESVLRWHRDLKLDTIEFNSRPQSVVGKRVFENASFFDPLKFVCLAVVGHARQCTGCGLRAQTPAANTMAEALESPVSKRG